MGLKSNGVPRALQLIFFQQDILFNNKFSLRISSGLKRKGINFNQIKIIIKSVKLIFDSSNSIEINVKNLSDTFTKIKEIKEIIKFIEITKKRGLCRYLND